MPWLAPLILRLLHLLYSLFTSLSAWRTQRTPRPRPLTAPRRKLPKHVAVVLVAGEHANAEVVEDVYMQCVENAVHSCREAGIPVLTMFDPDGVLVRCSRNIQGRLILQREPEDSDSSDSDVAYPLTPPLSDISDSRPLSPECNPSDKPLGVVNIDVTGRAGGSKLRSRSGVMKRRRPDARRSDLETRPLKLYLVSKDAAKSALASLARSLAYSEARRRNPKIPKEQLDETFHLTVGELAALVEGPRGFSSPDSMIVYHVSPSARAGGPLELFGFPPWQMNLPEIYYDNIVAYRSRWLHVFQSHRHLQPDLQPIEEYHFRKAWDEFADAELRLGK